MVSISKLMVNLLKTLINLNLSSDIQPVARVTDYVELGTSSFCCEYKIWGNIYLLMSFSSLLKMPCVLNKNGLIFGYISLERKSPSEGVIEVLGRLDTKFPMLYTWGLLKRLDWCALKGLGCMLVVPALGRLKQEGGSQIQGQPGLQSQF